MIQIYTSSGQKQEDCIGRSQPAQLSGVSVSAMGVQGPLREDSASEGSYGLPSEVACLRDFGVGQNPHLDPCHGISEHAACPSMRHVLHTAGCHSAVRRPIRPKVSRVCHDPRAAWHCRAKATICLRSKRIKCIGRDRLLQPNGVSVSWRRAHDPSKVAGPSKSWHALASKVACPNRYHTWQKNGPATCHPGHVTRKQGPCPNRITLFNTA